MTIAAAAFNSNLYVVGATVIPVLFIALVLPDGVLARYAVWVKLQRSLQLRRIRLRARRASGDATPPTVAVAGVLRIHDLLLLPVTAALVLFVAGEISAVHALDHRHASASEHGWVEAALVVLPVLAAISVMASVSFRWARIAVTDPDATPSHATAFASRSEE